MIAVVRIEVVGKGVPISDVNAKPDYLFRLNINNGELLIGSNPTRAPSLQLRDPTITKNHALLFLKNAEWWFEDLGSDNGSWKWAGSGYTRITSPLRITGQEIILIGDIALRFSITS